MFLDLILFIAVVGLVVWALSLLPIPAPFQQVITVVAVIVVVVALLQALFGVDLGTHFKGRWGK